MTSETTTNNSAQLVLFGADELRGITSFDDAVALIKSSGMATATSSDFGDGFTVVENKDSLLKVPFLVLSWNFSEGEFGDMVVMRIVTRAGDKLVLIDGSTGIREQMRKIGERFNGALFCERGLRKSTYPYVDPKSGKSNMASTYYLAL